MKRNYSGCAICDSTWGDLWAEVEGERMFFCCELCVTQFRGLIDHIKQVTGWSTVEGIEIAGDRRGRTCVASGQGETARFAFAFNSDGLLRRFERLGTG